MILFIEILKRAFTRLRTQEVIILYWVAGGLVMMGGRLGSGVNLFGGPFGGKIWDQYLIQSPQAHGLAEHIPDWLVPPLGSEALLKRSFLHPAWIKPIALLVLYMILTRINSLSLGYVMFRITSDWERLPFPMASVQAGGATALAETSANKETWRWHVFSIGSLIGMIWGVIYVVVPTLSGIFLTSTVQILKIPFFDFTPRIRSILPSTTLGIATDLSYVLIGFVLPFWVVVGSFMASMCVTFVANPLLHAHGILHSWSPGMATIPTQVSNSIDFWLSFSIGSAVIVGFVGFGIAIRAFIKRKRAGWPVRSTQTGRSMAEEAERVHRGLPEGRGDIRISRALLFWALSTMGFVILVHILVPEFPWWITAVFGFLWTPMMSYISARMIGLTGSVRVSFPYIREGSFYLSGYRGAAVWFAPIPMFDHGGMAATFKQLELTKTRFGSIVKLYALTLVVMLICSFLFWLLIWRLGPIPSGAYPFAQKMWPFHATFQSMWAKSTLPGYKGFIGGIINWRVILLGAGTGTFLYSLLSIVGAPSLLFYGIIAGITQWPHYAIPTFLGAMLGRYRFAKRLGEKKWRAYTPILLAGYSCGMGLVGMTSIAVALIAKAISQVVF